MKKLFVTIIVISSILFLITMIGFSQQQNSVLIMIESPNFEILSRISQLTTYYHDDAYLFGEIQTNNLILLNQRNIKYQIIDPQGWSGEYYLLTPRPFGPTLDKAKIGHLIYADEKKSIIKIDKAEERELFTAGYQLEKITKTNKPLPQFTSYTIAFPTVQDSIITDIISKVSA
ncbi:MAG: hypothetical protein JSW07_06640, partial [bacterium]